MKSSTAMCSSCSLIQVTLPHSRCDRSDNFFHTSLPKPTDGKYGPALALIQILYCRIHRRRMNPIYNFLHVSSTLSTNNIFIWKKSHILSGAFETRRSERVNPVGYGHWLSTILNSPIIVAILRAFRVGTELWANNLMQQTPWA
jgi:hypothetical protein